MEFKWDDNKAASNEADHQVSFAEARAVFDDPNAVSFPDDAHSWREQRFKIIGATSRRLLVVVYVEPRADLIRIISAWEADKREKRFYYEN